jgi:hypothetical protein
MTEVLWGATGMAVVLLITFLVLVRRVAAPARVAEGDLGAWLDGFSITRYLPMERLLSEADYEFLAAQPGYDPSIARKLRAARRRVFRIYLRQMSADFSRLHQVARLLVLYAPEDRPELARSLVHQKWVFYYAMANVQWRLLLHAAGLSTVDVSGLIRALDNLNLQVKQPTFATSLG